MVREFALIFIHLAEYFFIGMSNFIRDTAKGILKLISIGLIKLSLIVLSF